MMIRIIKNGLMGLSILLFMANTNAMNIATYLELKQNPNLITDTIIAESFSSLTGGIIYSEAAMRVANGETHPQDNKIKSFYCSPPNFQFNGERLRFYVDEYLDSHNVSMNEPIAVIAVKVLKEKFPCD
ncbi:TPA: hypothetical protein ACS781_003935 [Providencia alcalifaciens]|uniref:hypothetical protein n=1 Tax=Providencia alcalifaciens TaxID=126385 RepID=UPI0011DE16AE|nr:hypothetical protein [Providencia alcalifaciens]